MDPLAARLEVELAPPPHRFYQAPLALARASQVEGVPVEVDRAGEAPVAIHPQVVQVAADQAAKGVEVQAVVAAVAVLLAVAVAVAVAVAQPARQPVSLASRFFSNACAGKFCSAGISNPKLHRCVI